MSPQFKGVLTGVALFVLITLLLGCSSTPTTKEECLAAHPEAIWQKYLRPLHVCDSSRGGKVVSYTMPCGWHAYHKCLIPQEINDTRVYKEPDCTLQEVLRDECKDSARRFSP